MNDNSKKEEFVLVGYTMPNWVTVEVLGKAKQDVDVICSYYSMQKRSMLWCLTVKYSWAANIKFLYFI